MDTEPRIYVASLSDYNAGNLHGVWINCNQDSENIRNEIELMLEDSKVKGAEEWAIHDYENFGNIKLSEYESIETVSEVAVLIIKHGKAYTAFADYRGELKNATEESFEETYCGTYRSELEFATEIFDKLYPREEREHEYIDYESFCTDRFCGDYFSLTAPSHSVYIFRSN